MIDKPRIEGKVVGTKIKTESGYMECIEALRAEADKAGLTLAQYELSTFGRSSRRSTSQSSADFHRNLSKLAEGWLEW